MLIVAFLFIQFSFNALTSKG
ncbi:hypothetical protein BTTAP_10398 [Brochothrix thermosphacta]|nr:hypothetical protein BTTAP_10398 [Brochothrix thermosphacta]